MSFLNNLFGIFGSKKPKPLRQISASEWPGDLANMIEDVIARSGMRELPWMAAFVRRRNNGVGLCIGKDRTLPTFTNDPDVLVFCYLKDVPVFANLAGLIGQLLDSNAAIAEMLSKMGGDPSGLRPSATSLERAMMVDQLGFNVALELERKLDELESNGA